MGIEAITKALLRAHLEERSVTKEELSIEWGFDPKRFMKLDQFLDSEARVRLTCLGDRLHHNIAKDVSDRFEHGLENGGRLFAGARDALVPIASYLRAAIFTVAQVADPHRRLMLSAPYDRPRGPGGLEQYLSAKLVGETEVLAPDGSEHPICEWTHNIKDVLLDESSWRYQFKHTHDFIPHIGKDIKMTEIHFEIWDGGTYMPRSAAEQTQEADVGNQPEA